VARVIAVAEAYEVMTSGRPYRQSISSEEAAAELMKCAGTQFDPEITRVFVNKVLGQTNQRDVLFGRFPDIDTA